MVDAALSAMVVARTLVLGLGLAVTLTAAASYRRSGQPFARSAAAGFGAITAGAVLEAALYHLGGFDLVAVHTVGSLTIGLGFAALLYSLRRG